MGEVLERNIFVELLELLSLDYAVTYVTELNDNYQHSLEQ